MSVLTPWSIVYRDGHLCIVGDGDPGKLQPVIARLAGPADDEAAMQTARVMRAAPAMLAALKRAIGILEYDYDQARDSGDSDWEGQSYGCLAAARAAILTATEGK